MESITNKLMYYRDFHLYANSGGIGTLEIEYPDFNPDPVGTYIKNIIFGEEME